MAFQNVLITGGAGFIGSHLTEFYLNAGARVVVLDNLITGSRVNIDSYISNSNFQFIQADVSESSVWSGLKNQNFDLVLHFACPASPIDFQKIPLEILKVDSMGTIHALELARAHNARFVVASTSEVYGDPLVHPQTEQYFGNVNPIGLRSCYDEAKRFSEAATMVFHRTYKVNTGIVRIFNTYGPKMRLDDGRVVPNFCGQALRNEPLTVYGSGTQTRSFCYVDDLIDGITKLAASTEHLPVNIGNPDEYQIIDFAKVVLSAVPTSISKIIYKPLLHEDDPKQRKPDISRAKSTLGWEPRVSVQDGLLKTLDYFRTCLNATL